MMVCGDKDGAVKTLSRKLTCGCTNMKKRRIAMEWTASEDSFLREMWGRESCANIGKRLGRSKNSVIARADRNGLRRLQDGFAKGIKKKKWKIKRRFTPSINIERERRVLCSMKKALSTGDGVAIYDLDRTMCRWVMDEKDDLGLAVYCGHKVEEGKSFCPVHAGVVYIE